jgi:hypothetical protein
MLARFQCLRRMRPTSWTAALLICATSVISVAEEPLSRPIRPTTANGTGATVGSPLFDDQATDQPLELTSHSMMQAATGQPGQPGQPCGRLDCPVCNPPAPLPAPPPAPWKGLYFDNDFSYKGKPGAPHFFGEELKNMPLFDAGCEPSGLTLSFGGEIRHRHMNEDNRLRPGGPAQTDYDLWRWRNYLDLKYNDQARVYIEMIDASIFGLDAPALVTAIDKNRWDIQNVFFDWKIAERDDKPVYFRYGRQELLYGVPSAVSPSQQLLSPLDWGNTRRNFEGFKIISKGTDWDVDLFAVRPVNSANPTGGVGGRPAVGAAAAVNVWDNRFDHPDFSRWYSGMYSVYRGIQDNTFEPYYIWLQTDSDKHAPGWADGNRHTVGMRWTMTKPIKDETDQPWIVFVTDTEGAYQFGKDNGLDVQAGFFTTKIGSTFSQMPWTPQLTFIYYWGSGDRNAADGTTNTFNVLAPLGHAYWGIIDNFSGQNLNDLALQTTIKPHAKLTGVAAMHWFSLVSNADTAYNVAGGPVAPIGGGKDLGQELDLIGIYSYSPNFDVQVGYSWFWYGSRFNGSALTPGDATQFYVQTSFRY